MVDFLVIGSLVQANYKSIYRLFMDDRLNCGYNKIMDFIDSDKKVLCVWWTSFYVEKNPLVLSNKYDSNKYNKLYSWNAINVDKIEDIPDDYDGVMGVPITFILYYDKRQFKIVGGAKDKSSEYYIPPPEDVTERLKKERYDFRPQLPYYFEDGKLKMLWFRLLIKKK